MYLRRKLIPICIFVLVGLLTTFKSLWAQYEPHQNVTVAMFRLDAEGNRITDENDEYIPCTKDEPEIAQSYGCTAITEGANRTPPYPFASSTITISIDSSNGPDNNRYVYPYLWDVVPQELDMNGSQGNKGNKPLAAVKAQMIAARTYIYQRMTYIDQYGTPNNSNLFHVFLPYRYQALTPPQRVRVQAAAAERLYLTEASSTYPIEALYGADNSTQTITGTPTLIGTVNYLSSIADPISELGIVDGTGNGGMSSKGVSRWAFGHTSSRGPVAPDHPNYPHDDYVDATHPNGLGDFWSVRWENAFQILTHYYSGIQIRNANAGNVIVTPARRWVPLQVRWFTPDGNPPPGLCAGNAIPLTVWVQTTGTTTWASGGSISFGYQELPGLQVQSTAVTAATYPLTPVAPSDTYTATLFYVAPTDMAEGYIAGPRFEMFAGNTPFSQLEPGQPWPAYLVSIPIYRCDQHGYLPLVQSGRITSAQAQSNNQAAPTLDQAQWLPLIAR